MAERWKELVTGLVAWWVVVVVVVSLNLLFFAKWQSQ